MADDKRGQAKDVADYEWGRRHEVEAWLGELHEARNGVTGTPALALVPRGDVEWRPAGPCQLRLRYAPERSAVLPRLRPSGLARGRPLIGERKKVATAHGAAPSRVILRHAFSFHDGAGGASSQQRRPRAKPSAHPWKEEKMS